jgi:hypothetical protein
MARLRMPSSASQTITVAVTGDNKAAIITGTATGTILENETPTATGTLKVTDYNAGEAIFRAPQTLAGNYGSFAFDPLTGAWSYTLSADPAVIGRHVAWLEQMGVDAVTLDLGQHARCLSDADAALRLRACGRQAPVPRPAPPGSARLVLAPAQPERGHRGRPPGSR